MRPSFSIIILTFNGLHHLRRHLPGVMASIGEHDEVIVADNASSDGTMEWLGENHPTCVPAKMHANLGYCGGNNRAAAMARGDILLFLNNDVMVDPGWLEPLRTLFSDRSVWAAQPKILSLLKPDRFEYAGASGGHVDCLGYPFCRGRIFHVTERDEGQYDDIAPVLWASGAALAFRRDRFEEMGGFEESFEYHMEEIDLCWRAWNRGGRVFVAPSSKVYHLGGGSLDRRSARKLYYNHRNNLAMLVRNMNGAAVLWVVIARLVLDGVSALPHLLHGRLSFVAAVIRAHASFYVRLPSLLSQRRRIASHSSPDRPRAMLYRHSVVIQAFIRKRLTFKELPGSSSIIG